MVEEGAAEQAADPVQDEPMDAQAEEPAAASQGDAQPAPAEPEGDANIEGEAPNDAQGDEAAAVKSTPPKPTNGTVTRQRSGKATPARPQPPKHAPKPISKSKKAKKGKGKAAAKKALMQLYGYWRSGCTWRVRLCLALKGMNFGKEVEYSPVHLVKDGGE